MNIKLTEKWLRTRTDRQLLEIKPYFEKIEVDVLSMALRQPGQPKTFEPIGFCFQYLRRTAGIEKAKEFLDRLNNNQPKEAYYFLKLNLLAQYGLNQELDDYVDKLKRQGKNTHWFQFFMLNYHLERMQREQAESVLEKMISNYDGHGPLFSAIVRAIVFDIDFNRTRFAKKIVWGGKFLSLERVILESEGTQNEPVVYCLNLDKHKERWARCQSLYQGNADIRRLPGLVGDSLPAYLLSRLNINPQLPKTSIGCTFSHIDAWERIAENPQSTSQFVVEDDGLPLWFNHFTNGMVQNLMKAQQLDLLFIHDRSSPPEFALMEFDSNWRPSALPIQTGLDRYKRYGLPIPDGWGADGYCVSAKGARKLLTLLERDGFTNHIDWQMFLYSNSDWDHPILKPKMNEAITYSQICQRKPERELNAAILNFPLVSQVDFSQTTRLDDI